MTKRCAVSRQGPANPGSPVSAAVLALILEAASDPARPLVPLTAKQRRRSSNDRPQDPGPTHHHHGHDAHQEVNRGGITTITDPLRTQRRERYHGRRRNGPRQRLRRPDAP